MAFTQDDLERIRSRIDIVQLIGDHLKLQRAGQRFKALCPFHQEKTPSFTISPERQRFHCFGCGKDGDAFAFVMEYERCEFTEAVELLADRAGVELTRGPSGGKPRIGTQEKGELKLIQAKAASLYRRWLEQGPGSERARAYLAERQISAETLERFQIGFAPEAWDSLIRAAGSPGPLLEKAGLAVRRKDSGHYDRFRNRIMFPIHDARGQVIGFGGRILGDGEEAKYINSPETPIFSKGRNLYGLFQAREEIRKTAACIVVEGNFDLLALHDRGILNVVAPLGTALSVEHLRLLMRLADRVLLLMDGDEAGRAAALRTVRLGYESDITDLEVVSLPPGEDPDDLIRREGVEGLRERLKRALSGLDFAVDETVRDRDLTRASSVTACARELAPLLAAIPGRIARGIYIERAARRLGIPPADLLAELRRAAGKHRRSRGPEQPVRPTQEFDRDELRLVACLLYKTNLVESVFRQLTPEDIMDPRLRTVVSSLVRDLERNDPVDWQRAVDSLPEETDRRLLQRLAFGDLNEIDLATEDLEHVAAGGVRLLLRRRVERENEQLRTELAEAQEAGEVTRSLEIAQQIARRRQEMQLEPENPSGEA